MIELIHILGLHIGSVRGCWGEEEVKESSYQLKIKQWEQGWKVGITNGMGGLTIFASVESKFTVTWSNGLKKNKETSMLYLNTGPDYWIYSLFFYLYPSRCITIITH